MLLDTAAAHLHLVAMTFHFRPVRLPKKKL
jgi:hypothetical protein